jgi:hypothetical protein
MNIKELDLQHMQEMLKSQGYYHQSNFVPEALREKLVDEIALMEKNNYTDENLASNAVYLSDKTDNRCSYSMMVSKAPSELPAVKLYGENLTTLVDTHNEIMSSLMNTHISPSSRVMVNFQHYYGESKPVAEHFDGHYIKYDKVSPTEFKLKEGLLPQYVFLITLQNKNQGDVTGTVLREARSDKTITPPSKPGDLFIFDNIRFRHSVPILAKPRTLLGFRTFDESPYYFFDTLDRASSDNEKEFHYLKDKVNPGYIKLVSTSVAKKRLQQYYTNEWQQHWHEIQEHEALF